MRYLFLSSKSTYFDKLFFSVRRNCYIGGWSKAFVHFIGFRAWTNSFMLLHAIQMEFVFFALAVTFILEDFSIVSSFLNFLFYFLFGVRTQQNRCAWIYQRSYTQTERKTIFWCILDLSLIHRRKARKKNNLSMHSDGFMQQLGTRTRTLTL